MTLGPVGRHIEANLRAALSPDALEVIDESQRHEGHAGARPEGETHFRVKVVAKVFRGQSRVAQHRMVNAALADLLGTRVHALAIESAAP
jgi:BolA protein